MTMRTIFLILSLAGMALAPEYFFRGRASSPDLPIADTAIFRQTASIQPVKRDEYLQSRINLPLTGKGTIVSMGSFKRYGMEYRIVLESPDALKYKIHVRYYLFISGEQRKYLKARKNEILRFQGVLSAYTPLNKGRTAFILDVVLAADRAKTD